MKQALRRALRAALVIVACGAAQAAPKVEDSMAQRVQACTGCHGKEGRAASDGYYPRIAGKPAGYLYNQLLGFQAGHRHYLPMERLIAPLSDAYLREMSDHFSALELPYPAPPPSAATPDVLRRGEMLALRGDAGRRLPACAACHGAALTGVAPAIPGLLGLPRDYLNAQLGAWQTGNRRALAPDCMAQVARALSADDVSAVSHWLAAQALPASARAATSLPQPMPLPCGGVDRPWSR